MKKSDIHEAGEISLALEKLQTSKAQLDRFTDDKHAEFKIKCNLNSTYELIVPHQLALQTMQKAYDLALEALVARAKAIGLELE